MLNRRIRDALQQRLDGTSDVAGVDTVVRAEPVEGGGFWCAPSLLTVDHDAFLAHPEVHEEHFGPVALVVRCPPEAMVEVAEQLEGSLTATLHAEPGDHPHLRPLHDVLAVKAGRLIWNGWPTGVAVTRAMHHGGPYPATTNPLHTSVGTTAIRRFLRPVAFQNAPQEVLPAALRDDNPLGIRRLVDGVWTEGPVASARQAGAR